MRDLKTKTLQSQKLYTPRKGNSAHIHMHSHSYLLMISDHHYHLCGCYNRPGMFFLGYVVLIITTFYYNSNWIGVFSFNYEISSNNLE